MSYGIPAFRIKLASVQKYIQPVKELGGNFIFNQDLKESDFLEMAKKYDYVYLAFGLTKVRHLGIPGEEVEGSDPERIRLLFYIEEIEVKLLVLLRK